MPLAASTTTVSGRMPDRSTRPRRYAPYSASTSRYSTAPGGSATSNEPISASSRTCASPVSCPTGAAPARQSLIPLYRAGLWLAVNMAPGSPSRPLAKYSWSVDASPMWTTSAPREVTPSANAADNGSEDGRMSCPTTTAPGPSRTSTNAAPTSRAIPSCSSSGTTPRMSYALTMPARSRTAEPYRRMEPSALGAGQHAQVAPAADLVHPGSVRGLRAGGLAYRVGEREQVVTARPDARRIRSEPDDLPAPWRHESLGVLRAQVVTVRFGVGGQRPEDRRRVGVHVGERRDRRTAARRPGTATPGAHDPNVSATRPASGPGAPHHGGAGAWCRTCSVAVVNRRPRSRPATPGPGRPAPAMQRDRHGRGVRGPLSPAGSPLARSRAERFDDLVLDAVERLDRGWHDQLARVEFAVEDVPDLDGWDRDWVPLARTFAAVGALPARVVGYRRAVETRASGKP